MTGVTVSLSWLIEIPAEMNDPPKKTHTVALEVRQSLIHFSFVTIANPAIVRIAVGYSITTCAGRPMKLPTYLARSASGVST